VVRWHKAGDTEAEATWLAQKVANLRIFDDDQAVFDRSLWMWAAAPWWSRS
jgi:D-Tyr-tRNAtyr deacylase